MERERNLVTFICTANVCRSPMAEGLLHHALQDIPELFGKIKVVSAGISASNGDPASINSIQAMKKIGIDISGHKSKPLTQHMVDSSFAIFCMTLQHQAMLKVLFENLPKHTYLMREFLPHKDAIKEIADPFGQALGSYENTRDNMKEVMSNIMEFLKKEFKIS
ncbi:MAG: hypothetical protein A2007_06335 [Verrucomicrobia bacterium GWC2_42_7]|nr:MAG: hypothetical protein A2007_06335 [Verrucomicrobia bacterium GWC2_42_7]